MMVQVVRIMVAVTLGGDSTKTFTLDQSRLDTDMLE